MAGDDQQRITLTVLPNQVLVKTIPEVGRMPFTEFASLYAVSLLCLQLTAHVTLTLLLDIRHRTLSCLCTNFPIPCRGQVEHQILVSGAHSMTYFCLAGIRAEDEPVPCANVPHRQRHTYHGSFEQVDQ